jgi:hypothetical protein
MRESTDKHGFFAAEYLLAVIMRQRKLHNGVAAGVLLIAVTSLAVFVGRCNQNLSSEYQAASCEEAVEKLCTPEQLRAWATNLLNRESEYASNRPPAHPCLVGIWKHRPSVEIRGTNWGNQGPGYVFVGWGSGVLGGWGMAIGAPDLPPPPELSSTKEWRPGLYFWRRLH